MPWLTWLVRVGLLMIGVVFFWSGTQSAYSYPSALALPEPPVVQSPCQTLINSLQSIHHEASQQKYLKYLKKKFPECFALAQLTRVSNPNQSQSQVGFLEFLLDQDLLSSEILDTFLPASLDQAQEQVEAEEGRVLDMRLISHEKVSAEWMEATVQIQTEQSTRIYSVVFHLENGGWKIFGTEER